MIKKGEPIRIPSESLLCHSEAVHHTPGQQDLAAWSTVALVEERGNRVHRLRMKNITLSADEQLIERAHRLAKSQHKTLTAAAHDSCSVSSTPG